jgi:hypothetical protein
LGDGNLLGEFKHFRPPVLVGYDSFHGSILSIQHSAVSIQPLSFLLKSRICDSRSRRFHAIAAEQVRDPYSLFDPLAKSMTRHFRELTGAR